MRVYVAGKLSNSSKDSAVGYIQNCHTMMQYGDKIRKMGHAVLVPCHDLVSGLVFGDYEYSDYFDNNFMWIEVCDCMFICPMSEESNGTQREIARAVQLGIPVVYNLKDLEVVDNVRRSKIRQGETEMVTITSCPSGGDCEGVDTWSTEI